MKFPSKRLDFPIPIGQEDVPIFSRIVLTSFSIWKLFAAFFLWTIKLVGCGVANHAYLQSREGAFLEAHLSTVLQIRLFYYLVDSWEMNKPFDAWCRFVELNPQVRCDAYFRKIGTKFGFSCFFLMNNLSHLNFTKNRLLRIYMLVWNFII